MGAAAELGRRYFAAVAARDPEAMAACWKPGGMDVLHGLAAMEAPDEIVAWFSNTFRALPDFRMEVLDVLEEGEKVAVRWRMTGTFDGDARWEGALATGESIDVTGCDVLVVEDGLIVRNDAYVNGMDIARQLGLLPPQGSGQERALIGATNLKTRALGRLRRR